MIYYILNGHDRKDDIVSMLMMFYPNEKYVLTDKTGNTQTVRRFSCELSLEDAHITGSCEIQESNKSKGKNGPSLCGSG